VKNSTDRRRNIVFLPLRGQAAIFGLYWYRMLAGHLPLDQSLATTMTDQLLHGLTASPQLLPTTQGTDRAGA
jgi:hypothetical protein